MTDESQEPNRHELTVSDGFSIDVDNEIDYDTENRGWSVDDLSYEVSFEVELDAEEQIEMQVDDPRELARRMGKCVITDGDGKLIGLSDWEINIEESDDR